MAVLDRFVASVLAVIDGCTNPESGELLPDGETIVFGNARVRTGVPWFRGGNGLVYVDGGAFLSRASFGPDRRLSVEERTLTTGLTATLGCDVVRHPGGRFPVGTVLVATGGGPVADVRAARRDAHPQVLAVDPASGDVLGRIPLWAGSEVASRFNALEMPNGLAIGPDGTVYVSDMPNTNPLPGAPPLVPPAAYAIAPDALAGLVDGIDGAAEGVRRIDMPGFVNGLTVSPLDGACIAVSCSVAFDPVNGGIYRLTDEHFATGRQPEPLHRDLGPLDGVGVTRRGTIVVSNPLTGDIHALTPDGVHALVAAPACRIAMPADINVVYPSALDGEPALLVPDVALGRDPGDAVIALLDVSGL